MFDTTKSAKQLDLERRDRRAFLRHPDETIAAAAAQGDIVAWTELSNRYSAHVDGYIRQATAYASPEVLTAEVWAEVEEQLPALDTSAPGAFARLLYGVILPEVLTGRRTLSPIDVARNEAREQRAMQRTRTAD